jgi:hypothetical protein
MASSASVAESPLLRLPMELLLKVFESFESFATSPLSLLELHPLNYGEFAFIQAALCTLCRTCRYLKATATPVLYRNITLKSVKQVFLLFRTLLEVPGRGLLIRDLLFISRLRRSALIRLWVAYLEDATNTTSHGRVPRISPLPMSKSPVGQNRGEIQRMATSPLFESIAHHAAIDNSDGTDDYNNISVPIIDGTRELFDHIMNALFSQTKFLQSVLVGLPILSRETQHQAALPGFCYREDEIPAASHPVYNSITTLRLRTNSIRKSWPHDRMLQLLISFKPFPNLTTLEMRFGRSNIIFDDQEDMSRIKNLRLVRILASFAFIAGLIKMCTGLQTLYIQCDLSYTENIAESESSEGLVSQALQNTPNLKSLYLQFAQVGLGILYGDNTYGERYENDIKIRDLSLFTSLESLTVETMSLWGSWSYFAHNHFHKPLVDFLPSSLERLELIEVWYRGNDSSLQAPIIAADEEERYLLLTAMFKNLAIAHFKLPRLREIVFCGNWVEIEHSGERKIVPYIFKFLQESREALQTVGITFSSRGRCIEDIYF